MGGSGAQCNYLSIGQGHLLQLLFVSTLYFVQEMFSLFLSTLYIVHEMSLLFVSTLYFVLKMPTLFVSTLYFVHEMIIIIECPSLLNFFFKFVFKF